MSFRVKHSASGLEGLRDKLAIAKINARLRRASLGNLGDVQPVGSGVSEMRIDYGPGTASISSKPDVSLPSCSAVETSARSPQTSKRPFVLPKSLRVKP